jgi:adenylate cyclase class IV
MAIEMYLHLNNVHEVGAFIEINLRNHTIPEEQQYVFPQLVSMKYS